MVYMITQTTIIFLSDDIQGYAVAVIPSWALPYLNMPYVRKWHIHMQSLFYIRRIRLRIKFLSFVFSLVYIVMHKTLAVCQWNVAEVGGLYNLFTMSSVVTERRRLAFNCVSCHILLNFGALNYHRLDIKHVSDVLSVYIQ